jgi:5S rRNA maturation endonuclease (ribonuclease M5)
MDKEKKPFVPVDELLPKISLEQLAQHYSVTLPELHRIGEETRTRCFLNCGKVSETGDRVLAIQEQHPAKQWHCHQYGCGKSGNLVSLADLLAPGTPSGGRPRGERFKAIARDLQAIVEGKPVPTRGAQDNKPSAPPPEAKPQVNVPLKDSPNERARGLLQLDRKFVVDVALMPPAVSSYVRRRAYLTPEVLRSWRAGYLPRDTGEDRSGGTMRGKIVYPYLTENGDILTWFGRDPEFEHKHQAWSASDKSEREPEKFHFVKGFHRGLELFGQHRLREETNQERLGEFGLFLVEGPNDVIRLDVLGIPAVALCSNQITREQAAKAAKLARERAGGIVTVFLDCDEQGETGMKQCLGYLAQLTPVRLAWTSKMYGGRFKDRQPESLTLQEWEEMASFLRLSA